MKKIVCFAFVFMIAVSMLVVPSFAAESETVVPWDSSMLLESGTYFGTDMELHDDGVYAGTLYYSATAENQLVPGRYVVEGVNPRGEFSVEALRVFVILSSDGSMTSESYALGQIFEVPEGFTGSVIAQAQYGYPVLYSVGDNGGSVYPSGDGLYYEAFELFKEFIFGSNELQPYELAICSGLATLSVLFLALVPFVLVYWVIRMIGRW